MLFTTYVKMVEHHRTTAHVTTETVHQMKALVLGLKEICSNTLQTVVKTHKSLKFRKKWIYKNSYGIFFV